MKNNSSTLFCSVKILNKSIICINMSSSDTTYTTQHDTMGYAVPS